MPTTFEYAPDPYVGRKEYTNQAKIKGLWGSKLKGKLGGVVSKFFHYNHIPPHAASSNPFYQPMLDTATECPGVRGPTNYEIEEKYLEIEVHEMGEYIDMFWASWRECMHHYG